MADTGEDGGVKNIDYDYSKLTKLPADEVSPSEENHAGSIATSASKNNRMDKDDDGAPTTLETSPKHQRAEQYNMEGSEVRERVVSFDSSAESTPKKYLRKSKSSISTPQISTVVQDLTPVDMTASWDGSSPSGVGMLADPAKIAKEREKEERVRQARERLQEERKKKLEELREQQRMAQENREKQLEMRRKKIEDLRKRDIERRMAVEERRKMKEDVERARRESILQKAEERVARYEAWKAGGRKGVFSGDSPTKQLSVSTSVLYTKRSPEYSSMGVLHPPPRPGTSVDRSRARSLKSDEKAAKKKEDDTIQKQDQAGENEDKSGVKVQGDKKEKKERVSLSFVNRLSVPKQKDKEQTSKDTAPKKDSAVVRQTPPRKAYSTSNLATMKKRSSLKEKQSPVQAKDSTKVSKDITPTSGTHVKDSTKTTPSKETTPTSGLHARDSTKATTSREATPTSVGHTPLVPKTAARSVSPARKDTDKPTVKLASPSHKGGDKEGTAASLVTQSTPSTSSPSVPTPSPSASAVIANIAPPQQPSTPIADDGTTVLRATGTPTQQDMSAEEYKARLAEKRRQAREKAEKEAEEERKRQEEARLAEEERLRKEEEEERQLEEESLRLAEEARRVEEERLQKAIEAEERRKKEESEKLEQEKRFKEEADRKAKVETERLEKEKQEKARKEEEERLARKKKLEMIMKRVKTDTDSPPKTESPRKSMDSNYPSVTNLSSSQNSPEEDQEKSLVSSEASDEESNDVSVHEGSAVQVYNSDMTTSFMQGLEDADMSSSVSSIASTVTHSRSSGNHIDALSDYNEDVEDKFSHGAATISSKSEEQSASYERAQRAHEERLQIAIEAEQTRRKEALKRLEQERKAKEEAERKAKAETQLIDNEKTEYTRKEDEERLERKKRLETIMKRVKADTETPPKIENPRKSMESYPSVTHLSSSQSSPEEDQEKSVVSSIASDEEANGISVAEGSAVKVYSVDMTTSFMQDLEETDMSASTSSTASTVTRSMSSGNLVGGPSSRSEYIEERFSHSADTTPSNQEERIISETKSKFKSPLLQQLVENRGGDSGSPQFKSPLLQNLLGKTKVGSRLGLSASTGDLSRSRDTPSSHSTHMTHSASSEDSSRFSNHGQYSEDKSSEEDQVSKSFDPYIYTNGIGKDSEDSHVPTSSSKSSFDSPPFEGTRLLTPMRDSALGSSIEPHGDGLMSQSVIFNGHGNHRGHGMDDSSISLHSVEEGVTKSASLMPYEALVESEQQEETLPVHEDGQFDDLIDFGGSSIKSFEESNRKSDITDYLS